jgi:hypothetical protein
MRRSRAVTWVVTAAVCVLAAAGLPATTASAASAGYASNVIASPVPATYTPNLSDGAVEAIAQVGSRMIIGGTFTSVSAVTASGAGPVTARKSLLAFDATTGVLDTTFAPTLNGEVDAIVPSAGGTAVYVAGKFTQVNGVNTRVALISLATGRLVSTFNGTVDGNVNDLALVNGHLLVGGYFTTAGTGERHSGLASLNATTGTVEPDYFNIQLDGHHNYGRVDGAVQSPIGAISIAVSPDRKTAIVDGNFLTVADGVDKYDRDQIVKINLADNASVDANWNSNSYTAACHSDSFDTYMRDIGWSPDGKFFVVTTTGGYNGGSFEHCDEVSRFEGSAAGLDITPTWTDWTGGDSLYSVAVTNAAVYVGGHQRWLNNAFASDAAGRNAVARPGLAALSPATGLPLAWNPGRERGHGAEVIIATAAGIWVGSDTDYIGPKTGAGSYVRKKLAFFPYAGGKLTGPDNIGKATTVFRIGALVHGQSPLISANTLNPATGVGKAASPQPSSGVSVNWNNVRGAFMLNGRIWYGGADGHLYYRTFDGKKTVGPAVLVEPYSDPFWNDIRTGTGDSVYRGGPNVFTAEIPQLSAMFYANHSIYYTLVGDPRLYQRAFSADTQPTTIAHRDTGGVISAVRTIVVQSGGKVNFSNVNGMFLANGYLWVSSRTTGKLYRTTWNGVTVTGATKQAAATGSWAARGVFLAP